MRSLVFKAVSLTASVLALSLVGELALRIMGYERLPGLFYVVMSSGLLGFVPSAPALVLERRATIRFRLTLASGLLALILVNGVLLALVNQSDLGWSEGNYTLTLPTVLYAITCVAGFYSFRRRRTSAS